MPREPKRFVHRGWYVTEMGGQRIKLCRAHEGQKVADPRRVAARADLYGWGCTLYHPLAGQSRSATWSTARRAGS
jgi:hypothetical protein